MRWFTIWFGLLVIIGPVAPYARGENVPLLAQSVRYIGMRFGLGKDGNQGILYIEPLTGGNRVEVHLNDARSLVEFFSKAAPGQMITIDLVRVDGKLYIDGRIRFMPPKPGESELDTAYLKNLEILKVKGKAVTVLTLTKFGQTWQVEVPKVRTKDGLLTSPTLLAAIKAITPGTLAEIELEPRRSSSKNLPLLKNILPWTPWRVGVFSVTGKKKIDDQTRTTVEIKSAGIPLLLIVPKNGRSDDRTIMRTVYKLKKGRPVEFKIRRQGLNQMIRKIRPSQAKPKTAPAR